MGEPTDLIIVTVRGVRSERTRLLEQAKGMNVSLNTFVRQRLGLQTKTRRKRDKETPAKDGDRSNDH
jgi:hypothetical protein